MRAAFMFATGIENSDPTIEGGRVRVDQLEACGHYEHWRTDFDLVQDMGISFLRYGVPLHVSWRGPDRYDWSFADEVFEDLRRRDLVVLADLCHFGVPDWIGNFQNPDFPELFAQYARTFAKRYPWIQLYTPINEMFICAMFSALYGWWNEQERSDRAFVTAVKHLARANVLAMRAILDVRSDAIFVQSESTECFHPEVPDAIAAANILNDKRFLTLDLNYGRPVESGMYEYLMDNGMTRDEYHFFLKCSLKPHCIMGNDYYCTNEHRVKPDGTTVAAGVVFGYDQITREYHGRYLLPVMHTETNFRQGHRGDEAVEWLWKQWANVMNVRSLGVPIVGFTWYSLTDQVDWDVALREKRGRVTPVGLYDLDRNIRPVGEAYKTLIAGWRAVLPTMSVCLRVPVLSPKEYEHGIRFPQHYPPRHEGR